MAHNRAPKQGNKCCRAGVYFTREEYTAIVSAAKDAEISISDFVRRSAIERATVQESRRADAPHTQIETLRERRAPLTEMEDHCTCCGMPHEPEWERRGDAPMSGRTVAEIVNDAIPHLDEVQRELVEHNLRNAFIAITNTAWQMRKTSTREDGIMLLDLADDCRDAADMLAGQGKP